MENRPVIVCLTSVRLSQFLGSYFTTGVLRSVTGYVRTWGVLAPITKPTEDFELGPEQSAVVLSNLPDEVRQAFENFMTDPKFLPVDGVATKLTIEVWEYEGGGYLLVGSAVSAKERQYYPLAAWGPVADQIFRHDPSKWQKLPN